MRTFRILLLSCAIVPCAALSQTAKHSAGVPGPSLSGQTPSGVARLELAFAYSYVRANANPGQCGCFNMKAATLRLACIFIETGAQWQISAEKTLAA